ncbi:MAG TPA: hypothetical protein VME24_11940 [Alphaproteobacteria bacterium]|nr:hypothetical protein [Alphaproteobacteria bacterium]
MVSARSRKWGLNVRKTFATEAEALTYRAEIEESIKTNGSQASVPREKLVLATAYEKLLTRLKPFDKTPEQAVDHYVKFLGEEMLRKTMPTIGHLVELWEAHKLLDSTLDSQYRSEIKVHRRFIKRTMGNFKPDEIKRNQIDTILKKHPGTNNTRKKYLTFIRMFFNWVIGEGYIQFNPSVGIKFKTENFEKEYYSPDAIKDFIHCIDKKHHPLLGYYVAQTFVGLRPSEAARMQWHHVNFTTNELHVVKGKTDARHIKLQPAAITWLKHFKEKSKKDSSFIPKKNLFNLERKARACMKGKWVADGLRHSFATYFGSLKKDYPAVAWYMGNSVAMIKRHYAQTIPDSTLNEFWNITPE